MPVKVKAKAQETRQLKDLLPYDNNPRVNDHAVADMRKLLREYGFRIPMLVRGNEIVDGHLRYKAAQEEGIETVPVVDVSDLTDAQVRALRVSVNRSAEWASWDESLLAQEIAAIREADPNFDLSFTGFDNDETSAMLASAIKAVEKDFLSDIEKPENAQTGPAIPKHKDADAGDPADPHYVQVAFTMSESSRSTLLSYLKHYATVKGYATSSQALCGLVAGIASADEGYGA